MAGTVSGDGYPYDVPPEVLSMADNAWLRIQKLIGGAPVALTVSAYRRGRADEAADAAARNEPGAENELADQIRDWLDGLFPAWPADQELIVSGHFFRAPPGGGTARDYECHPDPHSHGMRVGSVIRGLAAALAAGGPEVAQAVYAQLAAAGVDLTYRFGAQRPTKQHPEGEEQP